LAPELKKVLKYKENDIHKNRLWGLNMLL